MLKALTKRLPQQNLLHPLTPTTTTTTTTTTLPRLFHTTPTPQTSFRDKSQDRTVLNPERSEGTTSGTDSEVARHRTAYDPTKTSPESEMAASAEESRQEGDVSDPLTVSGANQEVNRARDPKEGGPDRNADRPWHSSRGKTNKGRPVNQDKLRGGG